jgi:hypothetical protein
MGTPAGKWCPNLAGLCTWIATGVPNSACGDLLSQLTAGDEVSGIVTRSMMRMRNQSDEGEVTRFRRADGGSSVHLQETKRLIWSATGGVSGFSQISSQRTRVQGPNVPMRMGLSEAWVRSRFSTDCKVEPVKGVYR